MSIQTIRKLILATMALIVFSHIATWVAVRFSRSIGTIWGLVAAGVALYCRMRATSVVQTNKKYYVWLLIPVVLTVVPIILRIRKVFESEQISWWVRLWDLTPIMVSFVIPLVLLWLIYSALAKYQNP
jgi:hypothetical protein